MSYNNPSHNTNYYSSTNQGAQGVGNNTGMSGNLNQNIPNQPHFQSPPIHFPSQVDEQIQPPIESSTHPQQYPSGDIQSQGSELSGQSLSLQSYEGSRIGDQGSTTSQIPPYDKHHSEIGNKLYEEISYLIQRCEERAHKTADLECNFLDDANLEEVIGFGRDTWHFSRVIRPELEHRRVECIRNLLEYEAVSKKKGKKFHFPFDQQTIQDTWSKMDRNEMSLQDAIDKRLKQIYNRNYFSHLKATIIWLFSTLTGCSGLQRYYVRHKKLGGVLMWFSPLLQFLLFVFVYSWLGLVTCGLGWIFLLCLLPVPFVYMFQCCDVFFVNHTVKKKKKDNVLHHNAENLHMLFDSFEFERRSGTSV